MLQWAACIGISFDLRTLQLIDEAGVQWSDESFHAALAEAHREGLPLALTVTSYLFLHDRVQEAAYSLVPEERLAATHLRIGRFLLALINDILETSRIEVKQVSMNLSAFDLHELLDEIEQMFRVKTNAKGLVFEMSKQGHLPRYLVSDARKPRQVLINLLGNAIKFTEHGGILVHASTEVRSGDQVRLVIEIKDTGVGITEEEWDKVFRYFEQTSSGLRSGASSGLGMAISRDYARMMGGDLTMTSKPGIGSIFRLEIAAEQGREADLQTPLPQRRVIGLAPEKPVPRILVVEKDADNRNLLVKLLQNIGFEVVGVGSGQESLDYFASYHPQFIWLDIRMPMMDGLEVTRRIKATEAGKTTKIVALTASTLAEDREAVQAAGGDGLVGKPYREQEILETMARHLNVTYTYQEAEPVPAVHKDEIELTQGQLSALPRSCARICWPLS